MFRYLVSQLGVLAALIAAMSMIGVGATDTINRTGPFARNPSPHAVMTLGCFASGWPSSPAMNVKNTLTIPIQAGRVISWSFKLLPQGAPQTWPKGQTTLTSTLDPGQTVVVATAPPNTGMTRCRATVLF